MPSHETCIICSSNNLRPLKGYYSKHGLVKCDNCDFVFMEKIPTLDELESHYSSYSYKSDGYLSPITVKSYNLLLDEFEEYRDSGRILDVGCGRGWFLIEAKKRGWEIYGTEFSKTAIEICKREGIEVKSGVLDSSQFQSKNFDVITSFEVIEHINDPHEELKSIHELLRKGGLFFCTTPNFNSIMRYYLQADYHLIAYPDHLSYYTKKTLNNVLRMNHFKPRKVLSTGISITAVKRAKNLLKENFTHQKSADEKLRRGIDSKWYLSILKKVVNGFLTRTNTGMSLKGYYIKE